MESIKQQIINFLEGRGYHFDPGYRAHKYRKMVFGPRPLDSESEREAWNKTSNPITDWKGRAILQIYVGNAGAFRAGSTVAESTSITDDLRAMLKLPNYGESKSYYNRDKQAAIVRTRTYENYKNAPGPTLRARAESAREHYHNGRLDDFTRDYWLDVAHVAESILKGRNAFN